MSTAASASSEPNDAGRHRGGGASPGGGGEPIDQHDTTPPADRRLFAVAGVLLAVPIIALLWVGSYSRVEPRLWGFPFFLWYQMLWVFISTGCTFAAYKLVQRARPHRPMQRHDQGALR